MNYFDDNHGGEGDSNEGLSPFPTHTVTPRANEPFKWLSFLHVTMTMMTTMMMTMTMLMMVMGSYANPSFALARSGGAFGVSSRQLLGYEIAAVVTPQVRRGTMAAITS